MKTKFDTNITYFKTYEEREEAFRESVFELIPRKYSGPWLFWQDFARISHGTALNDSDGPIAYITANPRDCLVYGTAGQALAAAQMCARDTGHSDLQGADSVARQFALEDNLHQPVRTLSGGETVKVALAKAFIAADYCDRLTVASPFTWLSESNRTYLTELAEHYRQADLPMTLLALAGEDSTEAVPPVECPVELQNDKIDFKIHFKDLKILLATSINPLYQANQYAVVEDFSGRLNSPCLLLGENGHGKSLIAKALAGAVGSQGDCGIFGREESGPVRILLQDVVGQTLLRSFDAIRSTAGPSQSEQFQQIYQEIAAPADFADSSDRGESFPSLLEMKTALVAVRLCGRPAALILDEPDWGLSRPVAITFVFNVIKAAHRRGIPIVLISHKPWWLNAAGGILKVQRSTDRDKGPDASAFRIRLKEGSRNIP